MRWSIGKKEFSVSGFHTSLVYYYLQVASGVDICVYVTSVYMSVISGGGSGFQSAVLCLYDVFVRCSRSVRSLTAFRYVRHRYSPDGLLHSFHIRARTLHDVV